MNKLQLYIYKSLRGFKAVRNINPAENIQRHIHDMRHALEILDYDPAEKYLFYLISYIDEGAFFTILRTIPDQPLNHLATSIFVPNGLQITPDEMSDIVRRTTRMVSNPAVTPDELNELHTLFAKEYDVVPDAPSTVASMGRKFACCRYGGDTGRQLDDFFGKNLYQTAYLPYEGVMLVDAELGVTADADDLTDMQPAVNVSLLPPEENPGGFTPHIFHRAFTRPFLVPLGQDITVTWKRQGFEDRQQEITVESDGMVVPPIDTDDSRKAISPATFFITSHASKAPVHDAVITVNGIEINEQKTFTLAELKNADVTVQAPGYSPYHLRCDLAATTQALIQLPEMRKIYRFELPVKTSELGAPIRFEIHTKREITDSPIEGYSLNDSIQEGATRVNHLMFTGNSWLTAPRRTLIACAAALVLGFLLGWLLMGGSGENGEQAPGEQAFQPAGTTAQPEEQASSPAAPGKQAFQPATQAAKPTPQAAAAAALDSAAAYKAAILRTLADVAQPAEQAHGKQALQPAPKAAGQAANQATKPAANQAANGSATDYLDSHKVWTRSEMEQYPDLRGLFDDLNNYRRDEIVDKWAPKLAGSKNFTRVANAMRNSRQKNRALSGTHNKAGDEAITWITYTYKVDP